MYLFINILQDDAIEMGATDFVLTSDKNFADPWLGKVDLIIVCMHICARWLYLLTCIQNTTDVSHAIPLSSLLKTLKVHGRCILVALPDEDLPTLNAGGPDVFYAAPGSLLNQFFRPHPIWGVTGREPYVRTPSSHGLYRTDIILRGSKKEVISMLNLAVQKNVKSVIQILPST